MKKKTLLMISLVSLILAGICFYSATQYLDVLAKKKLYTSVVKVASDRQIEPFEPITHADVVVVSEPIDNIQAGAFSSVEDVVGKQSYQTIFAGEQIIEQKLVDGYLLPGKEKARYEFPLSTMMPITELRKGDFVKVWVKLKPATELETMPSPNHFQIVNQSAELLFQTQLVSVKDSNGTEIYTLTPSPVTGVDQMNQTFFYASKQPSVAENERYFYDYRAQPTALPAYVGFNLTDQEYVTLTEAMQYGVVQIGQVLLPGGG